MVPTRCSTVEGEDETVEAVEITSGAVLEEGDIFMGPHGVFRINAKNVGKTLDSESVGRFFRPIGDLRAADKRCSDGNE